MELCNGTLSNNPLDTNTVRATLRFEPVTVRAAVRVIQLQRQGVVSGIEADFYLSELSAMERHSGANGAAVLARMARRQASPEPIIRRRAIGTYAAHQVDRRLAMAARRAAIATGPMACGPLPGEAPACASIAASASLSSVFAWAVLAMRCPRLS